MDDPPLFRFVSRMGKVHIRGDDGVQMFAEKIISIDAGGEGNCPPYHNLGTSVLPRPLPRLSFRDKRGPWIKFRRRCYFFFSPLPLLAVLFCRARGCTGFGRLFDDDKLYSRARFGHSGGTNSWELGEFVPEMGLIYRGIDFCK